MRGRQSALRMFPEPVGVRTPWAILHTPLRLKKDHIPAYSFFACRRDVIRLFPSGCGSVDHHG